MTDDTVQSSADEQISLSDFFGHDGPLEREHPQYEFRAGQVEMAEAVEQTFEERRHLIVEAGTGTGKTLAYLLPALRSGRKVIVSTGTKALQEQLISKDIPFLESCLGRPIRACTMKGRSNYLCRQKLYDIADQPILRGLDQLDEYAHIREWERETETGDRAELIRLPDNSAVWPRLDARSETCTGQKCSEFERCFITKMHQRAAASDLVIVNHHLFFADLAVRQDDFAAILPDYGAVIFDEAHELEEVASQYFGVQLSNYKLDDLARDAEQVLKPAKAKAKRAREVLPKLRRATEEFFACFKEDEGRHPFRQREAFIERNDAAYKNLLSRLKSLEMAIASAPEKSEEMFNLVRRSGDVRRTLEFLLESNDHSFVFWFERRGRGVFVQATPIDVSPILSEQLFDRYDTVVLTSATLAVGGGFDYLKQRLGISGAEELIVSSHFDHQSQAVLYLPGDIPDPRSPDYAPAAAEEIVQLLEISEGRAFVLFTSYAQMKDVHRRVSARVDFPLLLQGEAPRSVLLDRYRETPHAVLFATASFWQGVDVQGESLSCVIVDRLPFAVPSDPVVQARCEALKEDGRNPFIEYQVPEAAIALKQGTGRLLRARTDRGILSVLDNRVRKKQYGRLFLESLPPYSIATSLGEVRRFFESRGEPGV